MVDLEVGVVLADVQKHVEEVFKNVQDHVITQNLNMVERTAMERQKKHKSVIQHHVEVR